MMNKLVSRFVLIVTVCMLLVPGCDNDLDLELFDPPVPVVYAILNSDDSIHYVRVERTYSGNRNAFIGAQHRDSLYFQDIIVKLDIYTPNGYLITSLNFEKRSFSEKETGVFLSESYELFVLERKLSQYMASGSYSILSVLTPEMKILATCKLDYHKNPEILSPKPGVKTYLSLHSNDPMQVSWADRSSFPEYSLSFYFIYETYWKNFHQTDTALITYQAYSLNSTPDYEHPRLTIGIHGESFYPKLGSAIEQSDDVQYRLFKKIYFELMTGNEDFFEYARFKDISNYGNVGVYTNVNGGLGIATFKHLSRSSAYVLDLQSMDSLVRGRFTQSLSFKPWM